MFILFQMYQNITCKHIYLTKKVKIYFLYIIYFFKFRRPSFKIWLISITTDPLLARVCNPCYPPPPSPRNDVLMSMSGMIFIKHSADCPLPTHLPHQCHIPFKRLRYIIHKYCVNDIHIGTNRLWCAVILSIPAPAING